jgi:23S rRNA (uracil1939-C5)-methyltransferase
MGELSYVLEDEINIHFSNTDFIQVNQQVNLRMITQALDWLKPEANDQILDLFCGLGNFSLPLAKRVAKVVGVEGVQLMVNKAQANAQLNNIDNCQFYQADLNSQWLSNSWAKNNFTKVLLDPARAGAEQAVEQITQLNVATILYVSCDPTTLAIDSQHLLEKGYSIVKIGLIDMFSQTKHVETMVLFQR